jgi:hypothetical protein
LRKEKETKKTATEKIVAKIAAAMRYEASYHTQAFAAYCMYSNIYTYIRQYTNQSKIETAIDNILRHNKRTNVFYANIETLKGLILPEIPNIVVSLNSSKKIENTREAKGFYDTMCNILQCVAKNVVDNIKPNVFNAFKMDYLITGRGILWTSADKNEEDEPVLSIDYVRWQDFAMDVKPKWDNVDWVARRLLFSKKSFLKKFDVSEDKLAGTTRLSQVYNDVANLDSYGDTSDYVEVWEYVDRSVMARYYVSKQYNVSGEGASRFLVSKELYPDENPDYFLPTPEPPLLTHNGVNMIPYGDVWTYINELVELSAIVDKRSRLIKSLHLRGYTDTSKAKVVNEMSSVLSSGLEFREDDEHVVSVPGFVPNTQEPLIYYVDNMPRVQMLEVLQQEYQFLIDRIYSITGISEQMRNITPVDDNPQETATAIRLKSKFGSRRIREHQQKLLNYWTYLLKILLKKICDTYEIKDYKRIFSYKFRDENKQDLQDNVFKRTDLERQLRATQLQMQEIEPQLQQQPDAQGDAQTQPDQQSPDQNNTQEAPQGAPQDPLQTQYAQLQAQNEQLLQSEMQVGQDYEKLKNEITWQRIIKYMHNHYVDFLVTVTLDDYEDKLITDEKKQSDINYMQGAMQSVNGLIQSVQSNPQFADMYCSLFSMAMETFDQTKSQRDDIDKFIEEVKAVAKGLQDNPPQQPPPTPQDQVALAQAQELQAKAQLLQAQIQEINAKIQKMQTPETPQDDGGAYEEQVKAQAEQSAIAMKHQNDIELQQMKIAADQNRAREKMQSDENLMRLKIEADKERYEEKMKGDYVEDVLPREDENA